MNEDSENEEDFEDGKNDEPAVDEFDPAFSEEIEAHLGAQNAEATGPVWIEINVPENGIINSRTRGPQPEPYYKSKRKIKGGARNIPLGTLTEAEFMELFYDDELLETFVLETNK